MARVESFPKAIEERVERTPIVGRRARGAQVLSGFARQLAIGSPEGIRTPDLFLERKWPQKSDPVARQRRIAQDQRRTDAPDGPNRASEKRPAN
jgi:hypothetical protein